MKIQINNKSYEISEVVSVIKTFLIIDPSYENYDCPTISKENWLEDCISLANKGMRARISWKKVKLGLDRDRIKELIDKVPQKVTLEDCDEEALRNLDILFSYFIQVKGFANATITKFLHKRFPELIPIVDSLVGKVYFADKYRRSNIDSLMNVIEAIRKDFIKNEPELEKIRMELEKQEISLTTLRIFDIFLWIKGNENSGFLFG